MKHKLKVFNPIRFGKLLAVVVFGLVLFFGVIGCSSGGGGPGSAKEDPEGCTDRDEDGYYAEEGCGKDLDCNDKDPTVYPGAVEYCVGVDNDCDGLIDEDCLAEVCGDGVDNDGDGVIDEECRSGSSFISDTGQTRCYDKNDFLYPCPSPGQDFYGQDACYSFASSPFTKLDAGGAPLTKDALFWTMVQDNVTGLIWEVKTDDESIHDKNIVSDWADAGGAFVAQLNAENFGGFPDWRLPTMQELNSIVNFIGYRPAINLDFFPNTMGSSYWSSTTHAVNEDTAWVLDFYDGSISSADKQKGRCSVRAVRGRRLSPTFTDNGDGTVTATDNGKSLMWMRDSSEKSITWKDALEYCENLALAGYTDWRLPNIKELRSLVDYEENDPAINLIFFPDTSLSGYWSSTTYADDTGEAWVVSLYDGSSSGGNDKTYEYHKCFVRPVRGGQ